MKLRFFLLCLLAIACLMTASNAWADRLLAPTSTDPANENPAFTFFNFTVTPNGSTIVANGVFNTSPAANLNNRLFAFPVPADPAVDVVPIGISEQISTKKIGHKYTINGFSNFAISPDGSTVLAGHDGVTGQGFLPSTIATIPLTPTFGRGFADPVGLFNQVNNQVDTGFSNSNPRYTPDGSTIFFINNEGGSHPSSPVDVLYSVPAPVGAVPVVGTPTAVTPLDLDIDTHLWDVNDSNVVYATNGLTELYTVPVSGGTPTQIPLGTPTAPNFDMGGRVVFTPDGLNVLFIGDYDTAGLKELYSVPVAGGTPTKINDVLPADVRSDVTTFAISPDGTHVAYVAGQNEAATDEVFYARLDGADVVLGKKSIRVSDAPPGVLGENDVFGHSLTFDPMDNTRIFYIGDMTTADVGDIYVVDTTEKGGFVPSINDRVFTYVGANGGSLSTPTNWENPTTNANPIAEAIELNGTDIVVDLTINGNSVVSEDVDFGDGGFGALILTAGASLNVTNPDPEINPDIDFDSDSTLTMTGGSSITTDDDVFLNADMNLVGGFITASGDDIVFQSSADGTISGTIFSAANDIEFDEGEVAFSGGATLSAGQDLSFEDVPDELTFNDVTLSATRNLFTDDASFNLIVTDSTINVTDLADESSSDDASDGGTLTLLGDSDLTADDLLEGFDLVLDDTSTATLGGVSDDNGGGEFAYLGFEGSFEDETTMTTIITPGSTATLLSPDASITVPALTITGIDPRDFIINGMTGMTYNEDPSGWDISDWDGETEVTLSLLDGDFDDDGDVDGADFLAWQRGNGTASGLTAWETNYGNGPGTFAASIAVPEPASGLLFILACGVVSTARRRE